MYKAPVEGRTARGEKRMSMKESFAKAYADMEKNDKQLEQIHNILPILKKSLMDHMVNRKPIKVTRGFNVVMDEILKSNDGRAKFTQRGVPVEAGDELVFKHLDTTMNQFIFKSNVTGKEYEIYATPKIAIGDGAHQTQEDNPGYYGLLLNTSIYDNLSKLLEEQE